MKKLACWLAVLCLLLQSPPAFALGLGRLEVKSQAGQPLLAEIPVISADPAELEGLQARLASPETFRRIGLEPPTGLVSDLRFSVALDARGRPVIRITSDAPVQQPTLTFLVEVDWGQGRLVREYSALVDTPQTVAAPAQPPIQAPALAPSNVIPRSDARATANAAEEVAQAGAAAPAPQAEDRPAQAPAPVPAAPVAAAPAASPAAPGELAPVQRGQTLGQIAAGLRGDSGHSLEQVMLALLRANPQAFIGGNLNLIRQGAVLRVPPMETWSEAGAGEASALVREHVSRWREMRRPVPQPVAETAGAEAAVADAAAPAPSAAPSAVAPAPVRTAEARLEIVPPSSGSGQEAGTRTGAAAGGEGEMLQQQELIQTRETLAARDAEVQELKARLAELEQVQAQQQQLIQLKDGELAAVQQRLQQGEVQPATNPPAQSATGQAWLWLGLVLLLAGVLAWWLARRRRSEAPPVRRNTYGFTTATVLSTTPGQGGDVDRDGRQADPAPVAPATLKPEPAHRRPQPAPAAAGPWQPAPAPASAASPTWHSGGVEVTTPAAVAEAPVAATPAPAPTSAPAPATPRAPASQAGVAVVGGVERIELARAYMDLGDTETARALLREVADTGDGANREEAARLLLELS